MENKEKNWISLDYLEILCQLKGIAINCRCGDEELWITPLGPHPSHLKGEEVQHILEGSSLFEVYKIARDRSFKSYPIRRAELESRIRQMMN